MSLQQNTFFDSPPPPQVIYLERKTKGLIRKSDGKTGKNLAECFSWWERAYFGKIGLRDPLVMVMLSGVVYKNHSKRVEASAMFVYSRIK